MEATRGFSTLINAIFALLLIGFAAGNAHAQETLPLKFTLPFDARWGMAILPAGDYSLSADTTSLSGFVTVRREPHGDAVALVRADSWERVDLPDHSKLIVQHIGEYATVRALYLEDRRLMFHYAPPAAKGEFPYRRPRPIRQTLFFAAAR